MDSCHIEVRAVKFEYIEKKMTWIDAIRHILSSPQERGIAGLKKLILYSVVLCPIAVAIEGYGFMSATSGEIPPPQKMVKSSGYFEIESRLQNGRYSGVAIFHTKKGEAYLIQHQFEDPIFENWIKTHPKSEIYVEGFVLKNGSGSFYPVYLKPVGQPALLLPDEALAYLNSRRSLKALYPFFYLCGAVWIFAVFVVYRTKKQISVS